MRPQREYVLVRHLELFLLETSEMHPRGQAAHNASDELLMSKTGNVHVVWRSTTAEDFQQETREMVEHTTLSQSSPPLAQAVREWYA